MFKTSAHFLLVALGILVFAALGFLAVDVGLIDAIFHTSTNQVLQGWINDLRAIYRLKGSHIELVLKGIGVASTAVLGMLAFSKGLHFAEIGLPARLVELIERLKKFALMDRGLILAGFATRNLKGDHAPAPGQSLFGKALRLFRTDPHEKALRRVMDSVESIDRDIPVLTACLEKCKKQRVTAYLGKGLRLAQQASAMESGEVAQVTANEAALSEIRLALELDGNDLDVLEVAAKLAKRLNLFVPTQQYLDRLEQAAQDQRRPTRHARALRFQAEVIEERGTISARRVARSKLEAALTVLSNQDVQGAADEKVRELALVNEQLASLHLTRGTLTYARAHILEADRKYAELHGPERSAGQLRVERLRARLAPAAQVTDEVGESDESNDAALGSPTYVNVEALRVYEAPNSPGSINITLAPYTALTVVKVAEKWALIARRGEPVGYVPEAKLRELT